MSTIIKSLKGHHEPQEEKLFYEVLKTIPRAGTMIELGSNWSYYSMWFNKQIEGACNYMIEPNPTKLKVGQEHFALNNMIGHFTNAFIGRSSLEHATFVDWNKEKYTIPQICIDGFAQTHAIKFIDILHSDIQGAEYDMLLGAKKLLEDGRIGYVFISTHGHQHIPCLNYLKEFGFIIIAEHSINESYSADGLIVARNPKYPGLDSIEISKR